MPKNFEKNPLIYLYKEAGTNYRYFLEWRHKLIVRYFIFIAGLSVAFGWTCENLEFENKTWIIFFIALVISLAFWFLDLRTRNLFRACQKSGEELENELSPKKKIGAYKNINNTKAIASHVLSFIYLFSALIFFILTITSYLNL